MELPNKIKECLEDFMKKEGAKKVMDTCEFSDGATWLNSQISLKITQSGKDKLILEMSNNARSGFTEFKMEYPI